MVNNQACINCVFSGMCVAEAKLKPFTEEAKKDLGLTLNFVTCERYITPQEQEDQQ